MGRRQTHQARREIVSCDAPAGPAERRPDDPRAQRLQDTDRQRLPGALRRATVRRPNPADTIHPSKTGGEPLLLLLPFSAVLALRDAASNLGGSNGASPLRAPATPDAVLDPIAAARASKA